MKKKMLDKDNACKGDALVARYSQGNVGLQVKRFVTASEKKERRERVLATKFA